MIYVCFPNWTKLFKYRHRFWNPCEGQTLRWWGPELSLKPVFAQWALSFNLDCMSVYGGVLIEFMGAFPPQAICFNSLPQPLTQCRL